MDSAATNATNKNKTENINTCVCYIGIQCSKIIQQKMSVEWQQPDGCIIV
jgi:hypothetical protein